MSLTASGGKVWRIPDPEAEKKEARATWKDIAWGASIWVLWAGIIAACHQLSRHIFSAEVKSLPVFGNEYGSQLSVDSNIYPVIVIVVIVTVGVFITPILRKKASISRTSLIAHLTRLITFACGLMMVIGGTLLPAVDSSLKDTLQDWAKEKYGYSVLNLRGNADADELADRTFDGVKANGEEVIVKAFKDGRYFYLYEDLDQLDKVFDEIIAKKKAIAEGRFTP